MTNEEVKLKAEELLSFWQKQLRLEDWDVTIDVPAHDPGGYAYVKRSESYQIARITLRNPDMKDPSSLPQNDLEITLVHELLHLRFPNVQFAQDTMDDKIHELGIERTAIALVHLSRGERR
jgi:hypothetical protein